MKKLILALAVASTCAQAQIFDIPAPNKSWFASSAPTKTLYRAAPNSQGVLIFFPGGMGQLNLSDNRDYPAQYWAQLQEIAYGGSIPLDLVLVDSPYPVGAPSRSSSDHIDRVRSVVEEYQKKTNKPIYLYGHSNGAISVARYIEDYDGSVGGVIFSAAYQTYLRKNINTPILVLHNDQDACPLTPVSSARSLYENAKSKNSSKTELAIVSGGVNQGDSCTSIQSTHAYYGVQDLVAKSIYNFIRK